jgi:hypothetical protein
MHRPYVNVVREILTRAEVVFDKFNFLMGWFKALRWQRLPEMERRGDSYASIDGIAAYGDHQVRFGVAESINTAIKAVLRRARGMKDEAMLLPATEVVHCSPHSVRSSFGALSDRSTAVFKSVKTAFLELLPEPHGDGSFVPILGELTLVRSERGLKQAPPLR